MGLNHFDQIADYLAFLREHPEEVKRLARDLLISVTSFFRDPEAFRALETEVITPLVQAMGTSGAQIGARDTLRCASGFPVVPPARSPIRGHARARATWRRPRKTANCKSSPPTSTRMPWKSRARGSTRRASPPMSPPNGSPASSSGWTNELIRSTSRCVKRDHSPCRI